MIVRTLLMHSRLRGRMWSLVPSRRLAVAQLRRELDRLPETRHPTGR